MTLPHPPANYDLSLENINFIIPEVLNFDTDPNHVSTAFPPELPSNQTPSLLAVNKMKQQQQQQLQQQQQQHHQRPQQVHHSLQQQEQQDLSSPVLPGQNDKSYNPQHFYHRQSSSGKVFTTSSSSTTTAPSQHVRPDAVFTPLVSPVVTPLEKGNASSSFSPQPPLQISFEPLTSPALNAEPSTLNSGDNSKNNNQQQQQQQHHDDRRRSASSAYAPQKEENKQYKRRTPHGTPILQGSKPSYISPSTKGKNGNNSGSSSGQFTFDKLPDSKIKTEGQDMLPPSGKPVEINGTPLMGFTMGKLAEGGESSAASSSKKSSAKSSRKSSFSKAKSSASSSENSSPKLNKKPEKPATKKASHKLAEQGRRNRMNQAVQELGRLIPQSYHDEVAIPSKATTVELASKYINSLLNEIEELKQNRNNGSNNNDDDDDEMKTKLE
ncbi:PHO4 Phosphate system positive regulatory protein PHO4 [Candida maltosa Xu316]